MLLRCLATLILFPCFVFAQTEVLEHQREGEEHRKQAEEFFESLHVVPPGMNWRIVNDAVRNARATRMQKGERTLADTPRVKGVWREVGSINQAGRIVAVDVDQPTGRVWLGGDGGTVWIGDTDGSSWKCLNETRRISYPRLVKNIALADATERLVVVSSSPRAYYRGSIDTAWKEATGLESIQRWGGFSRAVTCERDGRIEILCSGYEWDYGPAWRAINVVYRSVDSGQTYSRISIVENIRSIWTDGYANVLLVHDDTLSSIASDGSITKRFNVPTTDGVRSAILAGAELYHLMLAITTDSTRFYVSDDEGETWEQRGSVGFGPFEQRSFCQGAGDLATWMFGGVDVHRSTDDGNSWTPINTWGEYYGDPANKLHADIPSISSFATSDGKGLTFICTDGGAYISRNDGATVKNISLKNLNVSQYYGSYTSRDNVDVVSAGSQDQGYQRSTVETPATPRTFTQMISGDYANLVSGDEGHSIFTVYPGFTMFIPDAELGWGAIGLDFPHRGHMWLPPLAANPLNSEEVYLGGGTRSKGAYVYRYYRDTGVLKVDSLSHDFCDGSSDARISAIGISHADPRVWYVVTTLNAVWMSEDAGATWTKSARPNGLDGHYFAGNALAIDPNDAKHIYLGGSGYNNPGVYTSTDGGLTFTGLAGLPPCLVLGLAVTDYGRFIAAATDVGAFVYDTATHAWTDVTELGSPDQTYWHVDWVPPLRLFRFSTYGRGLWDFTPDLLSSVTETSEAVAVTLTGVVRESVASIQLESTEEHSVLLQYYDLQGRRLHEESLRVNIGTNFHDVPSEARQASMVVLVTATGRVAVTTLPQTR